jgi:hypothetical protein
MRTLIKNKVVSIIMLVFICSGLSIAQETESSKTSKLDLKIRSNSRDNSPERQDNLHKKILRPEKQIHQNKVKIKKENKIIKPNRKAILKRKPAAMRNRALLRNRAIRK